MVGDTVDEGSVRADPGASRVPGASDDPVDLGEDTRQHDFLSYVTRVAQARFVMRKVLRILDDTAKSHGLDGLEHQALLQIAGTPGGSLAIHKLADRLDIVPAFASRLVKQLESKGLIDRSNLPADKRVTLTSISDAGIRELRAIDSDVHHHMAYFQRGIEPRDRAAAMAIFAFYVGESTDSEVGLAIRHALGQ
jgi:DNA-binding MarR family transcriptional regulator